MENHDSEIWPKPGGLDNSKKINPKHLSLRNKSRNQKSSANESDDPENETNKIVNRSDLDRSASTSGLKKSNDVSLSEKNDSLCDFRSPIKDNDMNDSFADFEVKQTTSKLYKHSARRGSKPVTSKKKHNRNVPSNVNQPLIESSFFKPQKEVKTAFVCPVCFKSFKDATAQHNHMKSCAARNKISTTKLLDAVQLQEKQANERKALGLLAAPPIQSKKTISRKFISDKDPQLQLALALSMSLHEAQVTEEIEDAHLLAGEPCLSINSEITEERRKTLQNFGFTTNKPVITSASGKSKKKRPPGPTLLQTRTQEERDRFLTIRIAEILMGDEAITQALLKNEVKVPESESKIILNSNLLKSYHCVEERLWEKTQQCINGQSLYSGNIEISPREVKPEPGIKTPVSRTSIPVPLEETPLPSTSKISDVVTESNESLPVKLQSSSRTSVTKNKKATTVKENVNESYAMGLSKSWRCMLGASYMSDVLVIVKDDTKIYAHKTVFWARCYELLDDVIPHDPEKFWDKMDRILWPETEFSVAHAFLEFVYCGVIESSIFDYPDLLTGIRILARKYQLKKLFSYLRDKAAELKSKNGRKDKFMKNSERKMDENCDHSSALSEEDSSVSSAETDINSLSTACHDITPNKPDFDERTSDSDSVNRRNLKSLNINENENISANLVVDCFSSSNDSFAIQNPAIVVHNEIPSNHFSRTRMTQRNSTDIETTLTDITDIHNLRKSRKSLSQTNDNNSKLANDTLEEERCTSPDIFDDTISISSTRTYIVTKEPENHTNSSDTDVEVVCTPSNNLDIKSPHSNERSDKIEGAGKPKVDCTFVSTRQRQRSILPVPNGANNLSCEGGDLNQETTLSGSSPKKKSDITLAIEKIQRLNAKTASESDSDCETLDTMPMKRQRNPFRINETNTPSNFERTEKDRSDYGTDSEVPIKRRHKLSIFEKKIESEAAKNPALFNLPTHKRVSDVCEKIRSSENVEPKPSTSKLHQEQKKEDSEKSIKPSQNITARLNTARLHDETDEIFDLTQDSSRESKPESDEDMCETSIADKDLSMFTKYKRKHSHNSIAKYRNALKNISPRTSASSIEDTDQASSSNDSQISHGESLINNTEANCEIFSSKYEYTDPNQSTSNLHKELSNVLASNRSQESDKSQSAAKPDDIELSDLEIDLSEFSGIKSNTELWNSKLNDESRAGTRAERKTDDSCGGFDSLTDIGLADTEFTILKNDCGTESNTNLSDQETDSDDVVKSKKDSNRSQINNNPNKCYNLDEDRPSDIYSEETDTGEMVSKDDRPDTKKAADSYFIDEDRCALSSPDCEISGIFTPPSQNVSSLVEAIHDVDDLFEHCEMRSQKLGNSLSSLPHCNFQASTSRSFVLAPGVQEPKDCINLLNQMTEMEFDDFDFVVGQNSSRIISRSDKYVKKNVTGEKRKDRETEEICYILESDSSNSEDTRIDKIHKSPTVSGTDRSKIIKKRSKPSRSDSVTPEKNLKSSRRSLKIKSASENIMQTSNHGMNFMDDSLDREFERVQTPRIGVCSPGNNDQITPQRTAPSENITPLANYSAMKTPELRKELQKYGLKAQKRHRAKQLLRYIYNELHPMIPVGDKNVASNSSESSSEDDRPVPKRLNRSKSFDAMNRQQNTDHDSECETLVSDARSDASIDIEGMENMDMRSGSQSNNSESLENVFRRLIEVDTSLHNKILTYEPLKLEELHSMLKSQGLKLKLNDLMDFLDEQCITFRTMANSKKSRTRRKASPKKKQGTSKETR